MRRHFLALLTGALVLVLSIGVGVSVAASGGPPAEVVTDLSGNAVGAADNLDGPYSKDMRDRAAKAQVQ